jgi:hypothetical protein
VATKGIFFYPLPDNTRVCRAKTQKHGEMIFIEKKPKNLERNKYVPMPL